MQRSGEAARRKVAGSGATASKLAIGSPARGMRRRGEAARCMVAGSGATALKTSTERAEKAVQTTRVAMQPGTNGKAH